MKTIPLVAVLSALLACPLIGADAPGKDRFDLTTTWGESYKDCRILNVTPAALTVMHEGGVSKIPLDKLDATWQEKFGYDPEKAEKFLKEEEETQAADKQQREEAMARANEEREAREAAAAVPPSPLLPMPGEAAPRPVDPVAPVVPDSGVPVLPPITQVYSPSITRGERLSVWDGYSSGYAPYLPYGYAYGYGYGNPYYQPPYCETPHVHGPPVPVVRPPQVTRQATVIRNVNPVRPVQISPRINNSRTYDINSTGIRVAPVVRPAQVIRPAGQVRSGTAPVRR